MRLVAIPVEEIFSPCRTDKNIRHQIVATKRIILNKALTVNPDITRQNLNFNINYYCVCSWVVKPQEHTARAVGLALADHRRDIEVFPKSAGRNGVRLPRTRHPGTGQVYPIVNPASGEVREIEDLMRLRVEPLPQLALPEVSQ